MRSFLSIMMLLLLSGWTVAQDAPRAEVFGGYQYLRANTGISGVGIDHINLNGWNAAVSGYFHRYAGVTADFSGAYGTPSVAGIGISTKLHTFLFGPVLRYPNASRITPFAHALFGGGHFSLSALGVSGSETDFTWAAGGGLDANLNGRIAVRLAQADFLQTRVAGSSQNHFRYSAGFVIKF